jgi:hypothetical protein
MTNVKITELFVENPQTTLAATDQILLSVDVGATPDSGAIQKSDLFTQIEDETLFAYSATTVTTGNVTAAEYTHYDLTIAGLTANRDFNLPTPSAAGKRVSLRVLDGDATYALLIKANAVEITRVFIIGETLEFMSYGTGAGDWAISKDGRKRCLGGGSREATQAIDTGTFTKIAIDNELADVGGIVDIATNDRIDIRRAGVYNVVGFTAIAGLDDQEYVDALVYVNGAATLAATNFVSYAGANVTHKVTTGPKLLTLAVGNYLELYVRHNEGATQNTGTGASACYILVEEKL